MNRRNFLVTSLAAAAPLRAADSLRAGFIGTGGRGQALMRWTLKEPGVEIKAVCDIKPDRLDAAASLAARDNPTTYREYRRLLDNREIDAVYIATPCDLHVEMAIAAVQAGKHVYCEKPLGITPESIAAVLKTVHNSGVVFQVGQQMRGRPFLREAIARVHSGEFGQIMMVKARRHSSNDLDHEGRSADWFFDARRSGDVIVEMSVHNLDVCNWVVDSRPEFAAGAGGTLLWINDPPGRTNMDGYSLTYEYENGVKMSYSQVFFHPRGLPGGGQWVHLYTPRGAVDLLAGMFYPRERDAEPVKLFEAEQPPPERDWHVQRFFEAIRTGVEPYVDVNIGARAALTAILGREAIYRKRTMHWRELLVEV